MKRPPRVVIDTNLILSALVFAGGRLTPLRQAWQAQRVLPLVSRATVAELIRTLAYPKFRLAAYEQEELLSDYLPYCKTVRIPVLPPVTPPCSCLLYTSNYRLAACACRELAQSRYFFRCVHDYIYAYFFCPSDQMARTTRAP